MNNIQETNINRIQNIENSFLKAYQEGVYSDNPRNRELGRVGSKYGAVLESEIKAEEKEVHIERQSIEVGDTVKIGSFVGLERHSQEGKVLIREPNYIAVRFPDAFTKIYNLSDIRFKSRGEATQKLLPKGAYRGSTIAAMDNDTVYKVAVEKITKLSKQANFNETDFGNYIINKEGEFKRLLIEGENAILEDMRAFKANYSKKIETKIQKSIQDRIESIANCFKKSYISKEGGPGSWHNYKYLADYIEKYQIKYNELGEFVSATIDGKLYYNEETVNRLLKQKEMEEKIAVVSKYIPEITKKLERHSLGDNEMEGWKIVKRFIKNEYGLSYTDFTEKQKKPIKLIISNYFYG